MRFKRTITILSAGVLAGSMSLPVLAQDHDSYSRHGDRPSATAKTTPSRTRRRDGSGFSTRTLTSRADIGETPISFAIRG